MSVVNLPPILRELFNGLDVRVRKLEQSQIFQAPVVTADPPILKDGMIWYRSDLGTFRVRQAGATKTITTA